LNVASLIYKQDSFTVTHPPSGQSWTVKPKDYLASRLCLKSLISFTPGFSPVRTLAMIFEPF